MMKLGLLTAPFPDTPLLAVADWAQSAGFNALEIACWPRTSGPTRRHAGTSHIDVAGLAADEGNDLVAALAERNLAISALGYYPNPLHPDRAHRAAVMAHLRQVIAAASRMGLPLVNTFCGGDASKHVRRCDRWRRRPAAP
jgi:sugar phosphate isomerase/epimerase